MMMMMMNAASSTVYCSTLSLSGECGEKAHLTVREVQALVMSCRLDTALNDTALLCHVDLRRLTTDGQRWCFYGNLLNLMLLHAFAVCCAVRRLYEVSFA